MTVIATDGRTMAGDGRATTGLTITDDQRVKVHRLRDGRIVGCAGNLGQVTAFLTWLDGGIRPLDSMQEFVALVLNIDGSIDYWTSTLIGTKSLSAPQAIGSGADFALAAMDCGKSPAEAVHYATTRNAGCGGKVTTLDPRGFYGPVTVFHDRPKTDAAPSKETPL